MSVRLGAASPNAATSLKVQLGPVLPARLNTICGVAAANRAFHRSRTLVSEFASFQSILRCRLSEQALEEHGFDLPAQVVVVLLLEPVTLVGEQDVPGVDPVLAQLGDDLL